MDESTPSTFPHGTKLYALLLFGAIIIFTVFTMISASTCTPPLPVQPALTPAPTPVPGNHSVTSIELVFFHTVPGGDSCDQVGTYANETLQTYFSSEGAVGKITFTDVNLNLSVNRGIADRYGAYANSLWVGVYDESGFRKSEITDIWYYVYKKDDFMKYLKGVLEQKLAGTS